MLNLSSSNCWNRQSRRLIVRPFTLAVVLTAAIGLSACSSGNTGGDGSGNAAGDSAEPTEPTEVTLALGSTSVANGLSMLAVDAGCFDKYDVIVNPVSGKSASGALKILLSGDAEFMTGGTSEGLVGSAETAPILMPLRLFGGASVSVVLSEDVAAATGVAADAPIEDRLEALEGLTIATVSASSVTTTTLRAAVETVGVQVEEAYLDQTAMAAALSQGAVDGVVASSPYSNTMVHEGIGEMWVSGPEGEFPNTGIEYFFIPLGFTASYAEENEDVVARVIAGYLDASDFVTDRPEEAKTVVRMSFSDVPEEVWDDVWEQNAESFTVPIPNEADLEQFAAIVPVESRDAVQELELRPLLGEEYLEAAQALRTEGPSSCASN